MLSDWYGSRIGTNNAATRIRRRINPLNKALTAYGIRIKVRNQDGDFCDLNDLSEKL